MIGHQILHVSKAMVGRCPVVHRAEYRFTYGFAVTGKKLLARLCFVLPSFQGCQRVFLGRIVKFVIVGTCFSPLVKRVGNNRSRVFS